MADNNPKIDSYGNKYWYQNDLLHRTDGLPAVEYANGDKSWYQHGKLHRTDGPAIEYSNGRKEWYQNGINYSFKNWLEVCSQSYEGKCELVLTYG